jgi:hypothetical protein
LLKSSNMELAPRGVGSSRRVIAAAALLAARATALSAGLWLSGCYTFVPLFPGAVRPGQEVAVEVSDSGRVALAERLGPELYRVEGRVVGVTPQDVALRVDAITNVGGSRNTWNGEQVSFRMEHLRTASEKKLSMGRTAVLAALALGAAALIITQAELFGFGDERTPGPGPDPDPS